MSLINNTPSASLKGRFARAKKAAIDGKIGKVKVLAVSFVDVEMIERSETGNKPMGYSSFAHTFVIGISREGWRLYQAWGEHGYTLQEYLDRDRARLRDWDEAERFIKSFEALIEAETERKWTQKIDDNYEECFEVNLLRICSKNGPQKPIMPVYRP